MRIISGSARGKQLAVFSGTAIRPTPDKVRGAIFSMLYSRLGTFEGMKILDLCAGTGAMTLEALSRGAAHAWLVDEGPQAAQLIPANLHACRLAGRATFMRSGVLAALQQLEPQRPFDIIFLDPPYGRELVPCFLETLAAAEFLAEGGIICAEAGRTDVVPQRVGSLVNTDSRRYGATSIHFYEHSESEVSYP